MIADSVFTDPNTLEMLKFCSIQAKKSKNEAIRYESEKTVISMLRAYRAFMEEAEDDGNSSSSGSDSEDDTASLSDFTEEESEEEEESDGEDGDVQVPLRTISEA